MRVLRSVLGFIGGGAAMLVLDAASRRRGRSGTAVRALLDRVRPPPVGDDTVETRVRKKLAITVGDPSALTVSIEHGCVDLRGPVETRERARLVRAIASVPGVDCVQDLMTEPRAGTRSSAITRSQTRTPAPAAATQACPRWHSAAGIVAAGTGLGISLAALGIGGVMAIPAVVAGLLLASRAVAGLTRVPVVALR